MADKTKEDRRIECTECYTEMSTALEVCPSCGHSTASLWDDLFNLPSLREQEEEAETEKQRLRRAERERRKK